MLARETEQGLAYAGSAFVTLPQPARDRFWRATEALKVPRPALQEIRSRKASFVRPEMKVRVRHLLRRGRDAAPRGARGDRVIHVETRTRSWIR